MRHLLLGALLMLGCDGLIRMGNNEPAPEKNTTDTGCYTSQNDQVRQKLGGACVSCHGKGTTKPFFAELAGFNDLLAYNTQYVVAGKPEESLLIKLLEGHGTGTFTQMPLSETYQAAFEAKRSTISLDEIKAWVTDLPPPPANRNEPDRDAVTTRRITAEEIRTSLFDQLGLEQTDFGRYQADRGWFLDSNRLGLKPPNEAPGFEHAYNNDYNAAARFESLGAPNTMAYRGRSKIFTPSALQTLVQVSQAWCSIAVSKKDNKAVLAVVTLADKSETKSELIKQNIRSLYLRMLAEPPTEEQVGTVYRDVYLAYEPKGTDIAWVAVCASFVRDPLWLLF